jgi:hypothetical protein
VTILEQLLLLRSALVGVVGVDGMSDLKEMEVCIRNTPAPAADKAVRVDAIQALIATLEHQP